MAKARKKSKSRRLPAVAAKRPVQERPREYASSPCYAHEFDEEAPQPQILTEKSLKHRTGGRKK
jgi:hypothetical protein